jgi:hypothetical protein
VQKAPLASNADDFVPMQEAATRAYEELREIGSVWAATADSFAGSPLGDTFAEGVLLYFVNAFVTQNITIYGKHSPSRKLEPIDSTEFKSGRFDGHGETFHHHGSKDPKYIDLSVKEGDLARAIEEMKQGSMGAV